MDTETYILRAAEIFEGLTGRTPTENDSLIIILKVNKLFGRLRDEVSEDEVKEKSELIAYTAALMAAFDLNESESYLFPEPKEIGDLTVERKGKSEIYGSIIKENMNELKCIMRDDAFIFRMIEDEE